MSSRTSEPSPRVDARVGARQIESALVSAMRTHEQTQGLPARNGPDASIAAIATAQHGVVTRAQLLELGLSAGAIGRRLRGGRLHQLHRGVYAAGHKVVSQRGRWLAAVLACGPGAALSHRSAAVLWGVRQPDGRAIEVTTPVMSRSYGTVERHRGRLAPDERTIRGGIPVTSAPRTILDLAAILPVDAVEHALRESERLRLDDALSLQELIERHRGRRGVSAARQCLRRLRDLPPGVTRQELEARFLRFLDRFDLPRPRLNAWLDLGAHRYRADFLWSDQRLIAELDGFATHGTRSAFEDDRERDRVLQAAGWRIVRITWRQLHDDRASVAADLECLLIRSRYKRT
jgi:Transcriptional regulator, AbiEi antitoxin/Protein of unknown function (DUF559)